MPKPACIFWDGLGHYVGCLTTYAELAGPFTSRTSMHDAWRWADQNGLVVRQVNGTRGLVKHKPAQPLPTEHP